MDSSQMNLQSIIEDASKSSSPSLKTLCVIRCAIELCNQKEIREILKTMKYPNNIKYRIFTKSKKKWKNINMILINELNRLRIPKTLKDKVLSYISSVVIEILKWINVHKNIKLPREFCWTVKGTIDYKNTVKRIIENDTLCIKERFKLACIYCQDTSIFLLWIDMPFKDKNYFLNEERNPILRYWLMTMCAPKEKADNFNCDDLFESAFLYAVEKGYIDAVKYLFYKLDTDTRQTSLDNTFKYMMNTKWEKIQRYIHIRIPESYQADTWFFLFAYMEQNLQEKYFLNSSTLGIVLHMFLNSGRQKYLTMLMDLGNPNLNSTQYFYVSFSLLYKYILGCKDCNYQKTFIQFWRKMPNSEQLFLGRESSLGFDLFSYLIRTYFDFLLKKGTMRTKGKLISGYLKSMHLNHYYHFDRGNWNFLLFLIKDKVVTCHDIMRFKGRFLKGLGTHHKKKTVLKRILILIQSIRSNT